MLLGTTAACVLAAGCGGTSAPSTASSRTGAGQELAFSRCMRAHGVPDFPDPGTSAAGSENTIGDISIPSTIDARTPAFRAAWTACQGTIAAGLPHRGRSQLTAAEKTSMIAGAQCMRTHGVPAFQDPRFPPGGGIETFDGPGVDPQSPAYQQAAAACGIR